MAIDKPSDYFQTVLYTGNGTSQSITGVGFQPDFVWLKTRNLTGQHHNLVDVIRGYGSSSMNTLYTNQTVEEQSDETNTGTNPAYGNIQSLNSDGFTVDSGVANSSQTNENGATYVSWNWLAGGTAVSNTDGSITSSVSANTTAGFSIVGWTGTGANGTIGHGLGTAPAMIIVKSRGAVKDWMVGHNSMGWTKYINLNTTSASSTASTVWQDTAPTSSVFSVGSSSDVNTSSTTMIAYCFAEVKGYSKAFKYTGNGSADGTFIYTGMRPAFVLLKRTDTSGTYWSITDNKRDDYNVTYKRLFPNTSDAENIGLNPNLDFLSNGFKLRSTDSSNNASGGTYIGFAIAENPFVSSAGVPVCAR